MSPEDNENCNGTLPPDVLTNLPENIIDDILVCLPLRDAVRTSILSKKWRCSWCRLPALTLDQALWKSTNNSIPLAIRFTDIIYQLLTLHVGPLTKFTLSISSMGNYHNIDNLISFLSRNGIQHLVLQFPKGNPYKLPHSFFTCSRMRHLSLHYCSIQHPPGFTGFSELASLELYEVTISSELLGSLISCSPLLEKLVLQISSILNHLEINAPKLKSFGFTGNIKLISLKKVPFLVKLSLFGTVGPSLEAEQPDLASDSEEEEEDSEEDETDSEENNISTEDKTETGEEVVSVEKYFESFPSLEYLHLNYYSIRFLAAGSGDIAAKLSSPLNCLKCLCLSNICLDKLAELSFALCLIRSSPHLQNIQMQISYVHELVVPVPDDVVREIPASFSDVTLNHLGVVMLEGIRGTKPQMELIKLLLAKSPVLVRMLIQPNTNESAETRLKVLAKITKFPRASPKAEVDYNVDNDCI